MWVIATAGHVDHGKSTLVRALTGMEPDRWVEERRRGLTIDLGFVWTRVRGGELVFVDVPGHRRFVPNMLAGVGPVPAVLLVVAADEGWMPQSAEHLQALDAFGVRHGVLAVTRCDLADPTTLAATRADALDRIAATSLGRVPAVCVSGRTGEGIAELRHVLTGLAGRLPAPDEQADVRLWVDRCFTIEGAGTVVTGTLCAGTIAVGEQLALSRDDTVVAVRGLQILGRDADRVHAVARVAVNLRGVERSRLRRGDALLSTGRWSSTTICDVAVRHVAGADLPTELMLHIGSASTATRVRPLDGHTARLHLRRALPLRVGDRALLRDPGRHEILAGVDVLDVDPPELARRGAARLRAHVLATTDPAEATLAAHRFLREEQFLARGMRPTGVTLPGGWHCDSTHWTHLIRELPATVRSWQARHPLQPGMPEAAAMHALRLPEHRMLSTLADSAGMECVDGHVRTRGEPRRLPDAVERSLAMLAREFEREPFAAPDAATLAALRLRPSELAAAARLGRLTRIGDRIVLPADAEDRAARWLANLPQPFTLSQARRELRTTRRVAVPLLEHLDRAGITRKNPDGTHEIR